MDVRTAKKFFWKSFFVSAIFFIISLIILLVGYNYFGQMATELYHLSSEDFNRVFVYSMAFWKILIIQLTFIPALVLTCMDKYCSTKSNTKTN